MKLKDFLNALTKYQTNCAYGPKGTPKYASISFKYKEEYIDTNFGGSMQEKYEQYLKFVETYGECEIVEIDFAKGGDYKRGYLRLTLK